MKQLKRKLAVLLILALFGTTLTNQLFLAEYTYAAENSTVETDGTASVDSLVPTISAEELEDGSIRVEVALDGTCQSFDVGLMYDSSQVQVIKYGVLDGVGVFKKDSMDMVVCSPHDEEDYVVCVGAAVGERTFSGETIAYALFQPLEGVTEANFGVCLDSTEYVREAEQAGNEGAALRDIAPALDSCTVKITYKITEEQEPSTEPDQTEAPKLSYDKGDVIGDGDGITLKDAQYVLKIALRIVREDTLTAEQLAAADVVGNGDGINLKDGQAILKRALRIPVEFDGSKC